MRKDSPLAEKEAVTLRDLRNLPLICSRINIRQSTVKNAYVEWFGKSFEKLNIVATYNLIYNAALMVAEGLGCAFCMDGALAIRSDPRLRFIPLEPRHITHSVLVWKKNKLFSPATSLFIQEINMLRAKIE